MRRLYRRYLNGTVSTAIYSVHFYSYSQSNGPNLRKSNWKDDMSSTKVRGQYLWIFCRSDWSGRYSKSSHRLCSPAFRGTSLVCDCSRKRGSGSIALSFCTHSPYATPDLLTTLCIHFEHATFISTRDNPHNTHQTMSDYGDDGGGDFGAGEYVSICSTSSNTPR